MFWTKFDIFFCIFMIFQRSPIFEFTVTFVTWVVLKFVFGNITLSMRFGNYFLKKEKYRFVCPKYFRKKKFTYLMIFSNMNKHKSFIARFDVAQVATKSITITKSWRLEVQFHIGHAENVNKCICKL